jgi:GT2 family glycosyltransferase
VTQAALETVSVVVLTYNRRELLLRCLESLFRQTYPPDRLEIVVSDDGSTDGTREMMSELAATRARLVYARQAHRGIPAARNNGFRHAGGAIVAFVADDYVLQPGYVEHFGGFLRAHPQARVVRFRIVPDADHFGARVSHCFYDVSIRKRLLLGAAGAGGPPWNRGLLPFRRLPPVPDGITADHALEAAGAAAFRREVLEEVGPFDERLMRTEDTDLTARLRRLGIAVYYDPGHTVAHHYGRIPLDTLRKCFHTGVHRARLVAKHAPSGAISIERGGALRAKASGLLDAVMRAANAGSRARLITYLPVMLLFELADAAGYATSRLGLYRPSGSRAAPPLTDA